jgi:23S rRNA pseudouridine955/2504/2580 synthase
MGVQKYSLRTDASKNGARLDHFLGEALPKALGREVSSGQVRKLIEGGTVSLNGRSERTVSRALPAGARIEVVVDVDRFGKTGSKLASHPEPRRSEWTAEQILFEDEWLIVVNKPAGLPSQPTLDESRANVVGLLKDFLQKRDGGTPYLGQHHRLDRDTSGVLLFTKNPAANAGVTALFASRALQKTYQTLCLGGSSCPDAWEVDNFLGVVSRAGKASKFGAVRSGGDPAHTSFKVLERFPGVLLVEARPQTGRTHQIRVHLADTGLPILGDLFYGGSTDKKLVSGFNLHFSRVMLHAAALAFTHPVTNAPLAICSPLPADFVAGLKELRSAAASA